MDGVIGDTERVLMIEVAIEVHGDLVWLLLINQCRTALLDEAFNSGTSVTQLQKLSQPT